MRARKFWGWGYEDELLTFEEENNIRSVDIRMRKKLRCLKKTY